MKIKMTVSLAGTDFALSPGEETERFDDAEAKRLIEGGYAVPAVDAPAAAAKAQARNRKPTAETR